MESPILTSENIWEVYRELLARFEQLDDAVDFIEECEIYLAMLEARTNEEENLSPVGEDQLAHIFTVLFHCQDASTHIATMPLPSNEGCRHCFSLLKGLRQVWGAQGEGHGIGYGLGV